jgi:glycerate kinase
VEAGIEATLTVVVAPDSFKGSLPASAAAEAIAAGLREAAPDIDVRLRPVADGGEGSIDMVLAAGWTPVDCEVTGPTGDPVTARLALSPDSPRAALVELASASGLGLLPAGRPAPLHATTYGTGQLVRAALDAGAERIVLAIGGSATTDGGTGLAAALGARLLNRAGRPLAPGGGALVELANIDVTGLDPRLRDTEVVVACDVDNPLTGPAGAAHVYGPQKGAAPADVAALEAGLDRLAEVIRRDLGSDADRVPGAGAAGGVGAGALAFLGARLTPGIDLLLDLVGFDSVIVGTGLVVTGEGSLDRQSLSGKAPLGVARRAQAHDVPVVVLAGQIDLDEPARAQVRRCGVVATYALLDLEPDPERARRHAADLLRALAPRTLAHAQRQAGSPKAVPPEE